MAIAVEASAEPQEALNTTTHDITMPIGVSSGDLLIAIAVIDGSTGTVTKPTGWTDIGNVVNTGVVRIYAWYKIAGASETDTTFATSASEESASVVIRISGHDASTTPPEIQTISGGADTGAHDPPSISPSWGSAESLFIAVAGVDNSGQPGAVSSGYTQLSLTSTGGSGGVGIGACYKITTASAENPGTMSNPSGDQWAAVTIAVKPGGVVVPDLTPFDPSMYGQPDDSEALGDTIAY